MSIEYGNIISKKTRMFLKLTWMNELQSIYLLSLNE